MAKNKGGIVYSTNPNYAWDDNDSEQAEMLDPAQQQLRIWKTRLKGNKEATVIKGFVGSDDDLKDLAKTLKNKCAAGGNAKDGEIIIQGDHRDKVLKYLLENGYNKTKKSGG